MFRDLSGHMKYSMHCAIPWKNYSFSCVSSGTLERHETGETAKAILAFMEDSEYLVADASLPVSQESKRNKNAGYKPSSSYKHGMVSHNPTHTEKSADEVRIRVFLRSSDLWSKFFTLSPLLMHSPV